MLRFILACVALLGLAQGALAAETIAQVAIPKVSCRMAGCETGAFVELKGAALQAGAELARWDGAILKVAGAARDGETVLASSLTAIYDLAVGEELAVVGRPGAVAVVKQALGRYVVGDGAGPVRFSGLDIVFYDDFSLTPRSVSISYSDDFPVEFLAAKRQYDLLRALMSGARNQRLSAAALTDILQLAQTQPRPAAAEGTRQAVTQFDFLSAARTEYDAPLYTEKRIGGPFNSAQAREVCGTAPTAGCINRVANVRPENLDTVYLHCRTADGAKIDGNCNWLRAHDFVRFYGIVMSGAGRCHAEPGNAQRVFHGYQGGVGEFTACQTVYGGDVLPPEAEEAIFDRVMSELQDQELARQQP